MAWQSASGMGGGNGGGNVGDGGNMANQPQGTEYTLQGMDLLSEGVWRSISDIDTRF